MSNGEWETAWKAFKTALRSNETINKAYTGFKGRWNGVVNSHDFKEAGKALIGAKEGDTGFDMTMKAAGTGFAAYAGLNTVYRIGSGGGIYRDRNGNTDLIGLPFI